MILLRNLLDFSPDKSSNDASNTIETGDVLGTKSQAGAPRKRSRQTDQPKMGRKRKGKKLRVSRGVRLDPDLIKRADAFVDSGERPEISDFTALVEISLSTWLSNNEIITK